MGSLRSLRGGGQSEELNLLDAQFPELCNKERDCDSSNDPRELQERFLKPRQKGSDATRFEMFCGGEND